MSPIDVSHLSGPDAIVALRSYPRRFRTAALPIEDDPDGAEWALRIGPTGRSVVDHVTHTVNSWILLGQALHQVLTTDDPVLHPAITDADAREWETPAGTTIEGAIERLTEEAEALAAGVAAIHSPDWNRSGRVAGGGTTDALALVQEAVRVGAEGLRDVQATIDAVRP